MKKKTMVGLMAVVLIVTVVMFSGCVEEETHVQDSDGDSWSDQQEVNAGTDPYNKDTDSDGYWDPQDMNPLDPDIPVKQTISTPTPIRRTYYTVAATTTQIEDDIIVTYNGGPDNDIVAYIIVIEAGSATNVPHTLAAGMNSVGNSVTFSGAGSEDSNDHILVKAEFNDGTQQIILDTYM